MTILEAIDPDSPAAKGYETPHFDRLRPRYQQFVLHFMKHGDYEQAALQCGYSKKSAMVQGFQIQRKPEVVKALEEMSARELNSAEFSRASIVNRLRAESAVTMQDLCFMNEDGVWKPKDHKDIDVQWRACAGLVVVSREGNALINATAQGKARSELAKYMKWDREAAEVAPPISFNFGELKPQTAEPQDDKVTA